MNNSDTHLILPPAALHGCVRAFIARDRTGRGAPGQRERNHFPAAPFCTITWFLAGQVQIGDPGQGPFLDQVIVAGPPLQPLVTESTGPVHAFMVVLYPDAFHHITGVPPAPLAGRLLPARDVLPAPWLAFIDAVQAAASDGERLHLAQAFLAPLWQRAPRESDPALPWLQGLSRRLGSAWHAIGERQFERKVKQLTGQSMQALRRTGRLETALLQARAADEDGALDWAGVALEAGYSDQPHLCREVRRLVGTAPAELLRRSRDDDSYWLYRCWR